jgi:shikimate dehydrogenase
LSPRFQNAALEGAGISCHYFALDVLPSDLAGAVATVRENALAGNVTIPHKTAFVPYCDVLTPLAERANAVNTFWIDDRKRLVGDNTDVPGFDALVRHVAGSVPNDARVALLGSGGAAAAVCTATERWPGARVAVWGRSLASRYALAQRFAHVTPVESARAAVADADVVVNATPIGMAAGAGAMPIPAHELRAGTIVIDLVYRHDETAFVRAARARGLRAGDGLVMLLEQGAVAFERWFGVSPDRASMLRALELQKATHAASA